MEIKKVGVVGCGLMGSGIAEISARAGYQIIIAEVNQQLLDKGMAALKGSIDRGISRGKLTAEDGKAALSRITGTIKMEDFKQCDLVVEAIIEKMEEKRKLFASLDKICPPHTVFASNTSCLSIIDIAASTKRMDKVLGMHFFNPAPVMRLVELVQSIATSQETIQIARKFGESVGKTVVVAKDAPGFIVNRLLLPLCLEAIRLLENGYTSREDIDTGCQLGLNHPMGPLTLVDFMGVDTTFFIAEAMYEEFKDLKFAPPTLMRKMVAAGYYGRKSGKGFYDYK